MNNNFDNANRLLSDSNDSCVNKDYYSLKDGSHLNKSFLNSKMTNQNFISLIKLCKKLSIVYIVLCSILLLYFICVCSFLANYNVFTISSSGEIYSIHNGQLSTGGETVNLWGVLLASVGSIIGLILLILSSILAANTILSYKLWYHSKYLFVWFSLGIFLIPSFVGSILILVYCSRIKKQNLHKLESINNEFLDNTDGNHNLQLFKICKILSISYLTSCLILVVFIIVGSIFSAINSPWGSQSNYENFASANLTLIIAGSIFGFILFALSIVLAILISFLERCYSNHIRKCLFLWFSFGIFLIPSFIGSILTISNIDKIEKQYLGKKTIDKATKKVLSIAFTAIGSVITIIGVGLVAGTYDSYSNYQKLETASDDLNDVSYNALNILYNHDIKASDWNVSNWNNLDVEHRKESVQKVKDYLNLIDFVFDTFGSSQSNIENALTAISSLNPNSNADQGGVIAGSVLLTIGLVALITSGIFLGIFIEKEKKEKKEIIH